VTNLQKFTDDLVTLFDQEVGGEKIGADLLAKTKAAMSKLDDDDWYSIAVRLSRAWTPLDDPTSTDLIHAALNYWASEIDGQRDPVNPRSHAELQDAFTRAVVQYQQRRGLTGVAASQ
jgi:hypothetical protein